MSQHGVSKATLTEMEIEAAQASIEENVFTGKGNVIGTAEKSNEEVKNELSIIVDQIVQDSQKMEDRRMVEERNIIKGKKHVNITESSSITNKPTVMELRTGGSLVIKEGVKQWI
ncbi:hypothetical protein MKX01_025664 [Papaver californicum]|nr:hypothetical protein MKX01_025664 [Papaver californicum]